MHAVMARRGRLDRVFFQVMTPAPQRSIRCATLPRRCGLGLYPGALRKLAPTINAARAPSHTEGTMRTRRDGAAELPCKPILRDVGI